MKTAKAITRRNTRSGCLTCKHVKCDEQKPACLRCVGTKRICEGYLIVPQSVSSENELSDTERRAFAFFRSRTVHRVFGQQDAGDWISVFLHFGHNEASVKHAITALASLHESLEPNDASTSIRKPPSHARKTAEVLALKYYIEAIKSLQSDSLNMSSKPDLTMILCIIFICFEQFRSGDASCIVHLTAGLKLIYWWRSYTNAYTKLKEYSRPILELMNEKITPVLQRLRVQFSLCMDSRHALSNTGIELCLPAPAIPSSYTSLDVARRDFDRGMDYAFSVLEKKQVTNCQQPNMSPMTILRRWKDALDASDFVTEPAELRDCIRKLLELYYHTSVIITGTYYTAEETTFDDYHETFQFIVTLTEEILEIWKVTSQQFSLMFSFDLGITPPMFLVASRCRDSQIRRKAIHLMFQSTLYRGIWRDQYSGLCAQRIVELEEQGLKRIGESVYVPEQRRIRKISADIQEEKGQIVMHFVRWPYIPKAEIMSTFIPLRTINT
ncbi:uncharacterized protein N7500_006789 [Penicillium coprophilum]|uniref:uncharacterized protein n=1 Tax=Penicillium coprophilum TaxID=36646 RepID=UPI0023A51A27|nr:uncharacterized protein N7500_006789 [Penicillium coprophilum]KAJ5164959.1 hypothetical protein N7500_006789 [Penicillium coprophilum]